MRPSSAGALSLLVLGWSSAVMAAPRVECGTELSPLQAVRALRLQDQGAYDLPAGVAGAEPVVVPVKVHIVRPSDGIGGLSSAELEQAMTYLHAGFAPTGIDLCVWGAIDFIDSDAFFYDINTQAEVDALRSTNIAPNAANLYFTYFLAVEQGVLCGISSYTFAEFQGIVMNNGCAGSISNPSTLTHEFGHFFDLYHTHHIDFGVECPDGSNCSTAGDLICDTPADPKLSPIEVSAACEYVGFDPIPCGAVPYDPDPTNYMAYGDAVCRQQFSPLQRERALATLFNLRPELVHSSCPAAADLNLDDLVNGLDLALLLGQWGSCPRSGLCLADLDQSGIVNGLDLATLLGMWTN